MSWGWISWLRDLRSSLFVFVSVIQRLASCSNRLLVDFVTRCCQLDGEPDSMLEKIDDSKGSELIMEFG